MAKPYKEGKGWAVRVRVRGQDIYLSGYASEHAARTAAETQRLAILKTGKPAKLGPQQTSVGVAFMDYALEKLPELKGARQDAGRINCYLRACGLPVIRLHKVEQVANAGAVHWRVELVDEEARTIPKSLQSHRSRQDARGEKSTKLLQKLARMTFADVTTYAVQQLMYAMRDEHYEPPSIRLEQAQLSRLFNYARTKWSWTQPGVNPAAGVDIPKIQNGRDRVLTQTEWNAIVQELKEYDNAYALPTFALLLETAMRSSEPLRHARWGDLDWERCVLKLKDSKVGPREVPLSPGAMGILRDLYAKDGRPAPTALLLPTTYEALKKAWSTARAVVAIDNVRPHDLRHTAATRYALELNGNLPILKLITGHKTDSQLMRYINLKADDAVTRLHGKPMHPGSQPAQAVARLSAQQAAQTGVEPGKAMHLSGNVVSVNFRRSV